MNTKSDIITGWRARLYNRLMSAMGTGRVYEKALAFVELPSGGRLLDIGCGTGTFLKLAHERFRRARLAGVDASEDMLHEARKATEGLTLELACADAATLPFPDNSLDWVVSVLAFHHFPAEVKIRAIQEISRTLKTGGKCLFADFGRAQTLWGAFRMFFLNRHSYTKGNMELVERELKRLGLKKERQEWQGGCLEFLLAMK